MKHLCTTQQTFATVRQAAVKTSKVGLINDEKVAVFAKTSHAINSTDGASFVSLWT